MRTLIKFKYSILLILFWSTALNSEQLYSVAYWRSRFSAQTNEYIMKEFELSKRLNFFPMMSIHAVAGLCLRNPQLLRNLPSEYKEIYSFAQPRLLLSSDVPREKSIYYGDLSILSLINSEIEQAIAFNIKSIEWLALDIENQKIVNKKLNVKSLVEFDIDYHKIKTLMTLKLMRVANKEFGKEYKLNYKYIDENKWALRNPANIRFLLELLLMLNEIKRFESLSNFEINKRGKSKLFMSKEIAVIIFDDLLTLEYWLTPEFKSIILKLKKSSQEKLPSCMIANWESLSCTPFPDK